MRAGAGRGWQLTSLPCQAAGWSSSCWPLAHAACQERDGQPYGVFCVLFIRVSFIYCSNVFNLLNCHRWFSYYNANEKSGEGTPSPFKSGGRGNIFPSTCPSFIYPRWKMLTDNGGLHPFRVYMEGEQTIQTFWKKPLCVLP